MAQTPSFAPAVRSIAIAVGLVAVAHGGTLLLAGVLTPMRFLLLWCAVIIATLLGGALSGVVAVALSSILASVVLFDPRPGLHLAPPRDLVRIAVFAVMALFIVWIIGAWARAERRAAAAVAERERTFHQMADSAPVLVWVSGTTKECTFFNRGWLEYTGRPIEKELGSGWAEGVHPDDMSRCLETYSRAFDARIPFRMEYRLRRHDGVYRWLLDTGKPLFTSSGEFEGYIGACTDVTEEREAREHLGEANRAKDQFLATLSHELRTPLTAILGWTRMLRIGNLDPETTASALETIERSARAQQGLIDDLIDVSRIASGSFTIERAQCDVRALVTQAVESLRDAASARRVDVNLKLPEARVFATVDPRRFHQTVWNLVSNAIKFNRIGGHVRVLLEPSGGALRLTVSDDGTGIAPEFLPHVFERFRQADGSSTRTAGGLGLGLSIVKQLVELHGGTITAASEGAGRGATFVATFPILPPDEASAAAAPSGRHGRQSTILHGSRILIVDDDGDAQQLMRAILEMSGATVLTAASADEALVQLNRERPSLLISNVGMASIDAYSLAGMIRKAPRGAHVPMIAVGPMERGQDEKRAIAAGFNRLLTNPVDPQTLAATAAELMGR